jgi:two-component system aerobic respiration control sensor histidine kinase ArcB
LLVEDVPLNAEIATNLLEQRGHEVIWAETGEDALSFVATEDELDLVLLDMQLPDINGDEVAREIRADSHFDKLPIVALTANVRSAEEELEGISIQGALAKPINTIKLDKMLAELFGINARATKPKLIETKANCSDKQAEFTLLEMETICDFIDSMGVDVFKRSSDLFAKLSPKYCEELQQSIDNGDFDEYSSVAHKLKGASGSVGLKQVQEHAKKMEKEVAEVGSEVAQTWLDELYGLLEAGQSELKTVVDGWNE